MKKMLIAAMAAAPLVSFAGLYGDIPDAKHAWSVHDMNRPLPSRITYDAKGIPSDAIVLFDGTRESLDANWCDKDGNVTKWQISNGGFTSTNGWGYGDIFTKRSFGDCQLHIEYRHPADTKFVVPGNAQMRGNSGIFLMGQHELQVQECYYTCQELEGKPEFIDNYADGVAGAVYAENPPLVNAQRKPGEWQVYDIVFHQPVWNGKELVHPGSLTLFMNGVLVQDHWEMEGLTTHCVRRPLAPYPKAAPLMLQDHGCEVTYRNVWLRPLASRWDNKTHSTMSADGDAVMAQRRATAAELYAKIADPKAATADNVIALAEVNSYAAEGEFTHEKAGEYWRAFVDAKKAFVESKPSADDVKKVNDALSVLVRCGFLKDADLIK